MATPESLHYFIAGSREGWIRWTLPGLVAGLIILFSGNGASQLLQEQERDEPSVERSAEIPEATSPELSRTEQIILQQTNAFREQQQLGALQANPELHEAAQDFADFMVRTGTYSHTADGKQPAERAENHGYDACIVAENLAEQFSSTGFTAEELARQFVEGWKQSPGHRKNMLDPDVTDIGLAVARRDDSSTYIAVQMFGRPQSQMLTFQVRNEAGSSLEYVLNHNGASKTFPLPPRTRRLHQRCRSMQITFPKLDTTLEVANETKYVVRQAADGKLTVSQQ